MRIGILHNFYRSSIPSGENKTVLEIAQIFKDLGHEVDFWSSNSDELINSNLSQIKMAHKILRKHNRNGEFSKWISRQDYIQIHNYFPLVTKADLHLLLTSQKPIARVIHNYRKSCLIGTHYRKGNRCFKCNHSNQFPGFYLGCYNESYVKSGFIYEYSKMINEFEKQIDMKYVAISEVIEQYLQSLEISNERISLISNSVPRNQQISLDSQDCLFTGRLEHEKGITLAISTWKMFPELPKLHIVGGGTLSERVSNETRNMANIEFHGIKYGTELSEIATKCKIALFPLQWQEPFGRVVAEALSRGQSIAASTHVRQLGAVKSGVNGSYFDLTEKSIKESVEDCQNLDIMRQISESHKIWQQKFSPESISKAWKLFLKTIVCQ